MHHLRIVIAGPQFGEPSIVMRWLAQRYDSHVFTKPIGDHDALLVVEGIESGVPVIVAAPRMAAFDKTAVYQRLFVRPNAVLLVFTRISKLVHLNRPEYEALRPYLDANDTHPIVIANDARCNHLEFSPFPASRVAAELGIPVRDVTLGPFVDPLGRSDGIAEAWAATVASARANAIP